MSQNSNELLLLQIETAAGTPAQGVVTNTESSPDGLWLLLDAAPLSFLKLYRHQLASTLSTLPWALLLDGPRIMGARTANEERKDFWHSFAEEIHTVRTEEDLRNRVTPR